MDWKHRIRSAFAGSEHAPDDDVIEELAQHARMMYETARADGCSPEDAHRRVAAQIDAWRAEAPGLHRQRRRAPAVAPPAAASSSPFAGLTHDISYAARLLRREPRHALLTIMTMAVGIGATTVLFSITYGVLVRPLPWPNADRVVVLRETRGGSAPRFGDFTNAAFLAWREQPAVVETLAAWSQRLVTLTGAGDPERIRITAASPSLFAVLGARPLIGSLFEQKDDTSPVVVLSERLWRQRFSADPSVLGRLVRLDNEPCTVVGVLPDAVAFPDRQAAAIVPYAIQSTAGNLLSMFSALALLRPGATAAQAAAEGTARGRHAADTGMTTSAIFGSNGPIEIGARPLREALTADVRRPLLILMAGVALLLVTATANVAGLQLARATTRTREMAIRAAIGAGTARITRQLLIENLMIGLAGGLVGVALAEWLHRSMPSLLPADFPRVDTLHIDAAVLAFALVMTIGGSLACGLLPALRARRVNLVETLAEDGTAPVGAGTRSRTARMRTAIMAAQIAITCVLLVGASLLGRSFLALLDADRGFDATNVLAARLSMPSAVYSPQRRFALVDHVLSRLTGTPGVEEIAFTSELPLTPGGSTAAFTFKAPRADAGIIRVQASPRIVSPRYFPALGIRVVAGRNFSDADTASSEPVVIVNESFARRYLGSAPLGTKLPIVAYRGNSGDARVEATVIGVVDDVRYIGSSTSSLPEMYYSYRQMTGALPVQTVTLLARMSMDSRPVVAALRAAVRSADPQLVADAIMPLEDRLLTTLARPRLYAGLLAGFAGFALLIAAIGLFALLSYSVAQRGRELAIRSAVGARQEDLVLLVLRQGAAVIIAGLAPGLVASVWVGALLKAQLYGVTTHDNVTFVAVPLLLVAVGALASWLPARRAAKMDPLRVLRGH
jgi:putative ABC transport system permease protein